jgi:hypothetical protein
MRRRGQSINNLAQFLGRSTSFVSRILHLTSFKDLRKLPRGFVVKAASIQRSILVFLGQRWENWILGEGERPP